jgi:outer membrane protein assembly factor BamB
MDRAGAAATGIARAIAVLLAVPVGGLALIVGGALIVGVAPSVGLAQPFGQFLPVQMIPGGTPAVSAPAPPFEPPLASSEVLRAFQRFEALAADGNWSDALDTLDAIEAEHAAALVEAPAANHGPGRLDGDSWKRYETVASRVARSIAAFSPAGRREYERRVEGTAARLLADGEQKLDRKALARVANEFGASREAERALLLLGELALERGDYAASRRWWNRLHPLVVGPRGLPCGVELAGIDPRVTPETLAQRWTQLERPASGEVVSDPLGSAAEALSRLCVVSIREGDLDRAATELRLLDALDPNAVGRLAGRERPLAEGLREMIDAGASQTAMRLGPLRGWQWSRRIPMKAPAAGGTQLAVAQRMFQVDPFGRMRVLNTGRQAAAADAPLPGAWAVAVGDLVIAADAAGAIAARLLDGEPIDAAIPKEWRPAKPGAPADPRDFRMAIGGVGARVIVNGQLFINGQPIGVAQGNAGTGGGVLPGVPREAPVASRGVLYFRQQRAPRRVAVGFPNLAVRESLVGIDLARDGKVVFDASPYADGAPSETIRQFVGPPLVSGDRLWVLLAARELRPRLELACYSLAGGRLLWSTPLGSGQPAGGDESFAPRLSMGDEAVFVATDLGAIVAVDARSGRTRWVARYPRAAIALGSFGLSAPRDAGAPILAGDRLVVAPADSPDVLAFDAASGRSIWRVERTASSAALVGIARGVAVMAGSRVEGIDVATGRRRYAWPDSERAGVRGAGAPLMVGDELFWPTRDRLFILDGATGVQSRLSFDLTEVGARGANLAAAPDGLLVAGSRGVQLLGPRAAALAPPGGQPDATGVGEPPTADKRSIPGGTASVAVN